MSSTQGTTHSRPLPLAGLTVVELGHSVAAPYAGEILGELGARVVKIEKAQGDDARSWGPPFWFGASALFQSLNRNKLSVVADLRNQEDVAQVRCFVLQQADVLIQNLRPGNLEGTGLDAESLRLQRPDLIYCTIGAFGAAGPLSGNPGYDPLMQAYSGLMSVTGEPEGSPVRVGVSMIDMAAGMWSVIGVLAALLQRKSDGGGARVDTSLYESALAWMSSHIACYLASGELPQRQGSGTSMIVPYRAYETSDGHIVIGAGNDKLFALLAQVVNRPEWAHDPRFRTNPDRVRNKDLLYAQLEEIVKQRSNVQWQEALDAAGVPNAPIQTINQVVNNPQTKALGILQQSEDGQLSLIGLPLSFDGKRPPLRSIAPALGEHTRQILRKPALPPEQAMP